MTISLQQALLAISLSSTIATALFWGAIYLGRLTTRLERVEGRVLDHDRDMAELIKLLRSEALKP